MNESEVVKIQAQAQSWPAEELLRWARGVFAPGRLVFATSLGAEDQVLTHMITVSGGGIPVFTLDTGRLPQETYDCLQATRDAYGLIVETVFPDRQEVESMVNQYGPNLFYGSLENRRRCCEVRKVLPLRRRLAGMEAWVVGMRREQALTRQTLEKVEWDTANRLVKINPLADWSLDMVWEYIRKHGVPVNRLHAKGYPSIGCAPCTRAVEPGADIRSGRWWWENPEHKECGLHHRQKKG